MVYKETERRLLHNKFVENKLKNPVYHISLDFAHEDTPKLTDDLMVEIAREYMRRMGITNTQYICLLYTSRCV